MSSIRPLSRARPVNYYVSKWSSEDHKYERPNPDTGAEYVKSPDLAFMARDIRQAGDLIIHLNEAIKEKEKERFNASKIVVEYWRELEKGKG